VPAHCTRLAGLFDSFRYSKLGFKASLKNDLLSLRGVESRGDQEFLVIAAFCADVNIISHTQNIAFSELVIDWNGLNLTSNRVEELC